MSGENFVWMTKVTQGFIDPVPVAESAYYAVWQPLGWDLVPAPADPTLTPSTPFIMRGTWQQYDYYNVGDVVQYTTDLYVCKVAHYADTFYALNFDKISPAGPTTLAANVAFTPTGGLASTDVQAALAEVDSEKSSVSHTHSYAASQISVTPFTGISAADVQAALVEIYAEKSDVGHVHSAGQVTFTPGGNLSSGTVQAALNELDAEKATVSHTHPAEFSGYDSHVNATQNVHGVGAGNSVVGTGTAQTLTNKTLTAPTINNPVIPTGQWASAQHDHGTSANGGDIAGGGGLNAAFMMMGG